MYKLDAELAKKSDGGDYITTTGSYVGQLTLAKRSVSTKSTEGIEFSFKTDDGQVANYLSIWTKNKEGEELSGMKALMAMMTICKLREISLAKKSVQGRNGAEVVECFPGFEGKRIGLCFEREEFVKSDDSIGFQLNIAGCFDPATGLTASEIMNGLASGQGSKLSALQARLKDRPRRPKKGSTGAASGNAVADLDDDIPF